MSAVIYAAIVVMWAIVLVPMWLRRHDANVENRSVDRFSTAMRTLSRRTHATPGRRYVVMPRRQAGALSVHVSGASAPQRSGSRPVAPARPARPAAPRRGRGSIVARRRRALLGLSSLVLLSFFLAVAGVLSWPLQLVLDLVLGAFVAHLRAQARRAAVVSRQRRRVTTPPDRRVATSPAGARTRPAAAVASAPAATVDPDDVDTQVLTVDERTDVEITWEPVPVPPPTYTLKPPAPEMPAAAAQAAEPVGDAAEEITALDEILERRWAVND